MQSPIPPLKFAGAAGGGASLHDLDPQRDDAILPEILADLMAAPPGESRAALIEALNALARYLEVDVHALQFGPDKGVVPVGSSHPGKAQSPGLTPDNPIQGLSPADFDKSGNMGDLTQLCSSHPWHRLPIASDTSSLGASRVTFGQGDHSVVVLLSSPERFHPGCERTDLADALAGVLQAFLFNRRTAATRDEYPIGLLGGPISDGSVKQPSLLTRLSHELRMPLDGILGIIEFLQSQGDDLSESSLGMLGLIHDAGGSLLRTIDTLLDIARINAGGVSLRNRRIDLEEIARSCIEAHRLTATEKGLVLHFEARGCEDGCLRIGDERRMRQILCNLLDNAIKFTSSGHVSLKLDCSDLRMVQMAVEDTGSGIADHDKPFIFSEFYQAANEGGQFSTSGAGLGLPLTARIVTLIGGRIQVTSSPGAGSRFSLALPMPAASLAEVYRNPDSGTSDPVVSLEGHRILLAEDNPSSRMIMRALLERLHATVIEVSNGAEAIEVWNQQDFSIIILDISMPVLDGLEAMKAIRAGSEGVGRKCPPIVAYTAHTLEHEIDACLDMGFDSYILKPTTLADLGACLCDLGLSSNLAEHGDADSRITLPV